MFVGRGLSEGVSSNGPRVQGVALADAASDAAAGRVPLARPRQTEDVPGSGDTSPETGNILLCSDLRVDCPQTDLRDTCRAEKAGTNSAGFPIHCLHSIAGMAGLSVLPEAKAVSLRGPEVRISGRSSGSGRR